MQTKPTYLIKLSCSLRQLVTYPTGYRRFIDKTIWPMLSEQPERYSTYVPERLGDSIPPLLPQRQRHYVLERFNTWDVLFQRYKAPEIQIGL